MNPELTFALKLEGMLRLSLVVAQGALARTESRGAHFRSDHPLRDDANWLNRTLVHWHANAAGPSFSYEPVGLIDLPPGHRGYGSDTRHEMKTSIEDYNDAVASAQRSAGRLPTEQPPGSRMRWGSWQSTGVTS